MSVAVYSNLLSSVEILCITSLAENHADFAAACHSKMVVLIVREVSQTHPLYIFHMLKYTSVLLNLATIPAFSVLDQAFPKLNIPNSIFIFYESEFLNLYLLRYPPPDDFNELMIWTQFFICGMTIKEYSDLEYRPAI